MAQGHTFITTHLACFDDFNLIIVALCTIIVFSLYNVSGMGYFAFPHSFIVPHLLEVPKLQKATS